MRISSQEKMGFYATPANLLPTLASYLGKLVTSSVSLEWNAIHHNFGKE